MIYLDSAATSLLKPPSVRRAMERAVSTLSSPGRGSYRSAMDAADTVYACREAAAELFHAEPSQVVFTMNATHGLNLAIRSVVKPGMRVLISGYEHNAVLRPLHALGAEVSVLPTPLFDQAAALSAFKRELGRCNAVVCTHVSNVFGFVLPIEELAAECKKAGVPLIVDAAQSAGLWELDFAALGCAYVAMPGHKGLMGPQGTGILLCAEVGEPLLYGGTGFDSRSLTMPEALPERLEAGTVNVPGIAGLLEGLRYILLTGTATLRRREEKLLTLFADELDGSGLRLFRTAEQGVQSGVLSLLPAVGESEAAAAALGKAGIAVRGGLHCAPLAHRTAGTLDTGTVRFSFSPLLSEREVLMAARATKEILKSDYNL